MPTTRFDYVRYDEISLDLQFEFKEAFMDLSERIEAMLPGRAKQLALTKLEESYMWIGKAIRDEQIDRGAPSPLQEERKDDSL